ncbi:unnamed protein product [Brachionus calyciflorus]|uniref:Uncharacterized protein n=1 Tax=Brachionus calyciflorus TaxID=104777 RepID=A0A814H5L4_9BILA|nr:unnamed protein product [Brachionus calyciflorus]
MDEIDIRFCCESFTKYSNLINKTDEIICPECSKHYVNIKETLKIPINREKILRKEVELFFEKLELSNINKCIERQFNEITFQIDIQCESLIEKINNYRIELIEKVKKNRNDIIRQLDKSKIVNKISKNLYIEEFEKTKNLFDKLKIEEDTKQKLKEKERMENEIKDEIDKYKFLKPEKNIEIEEIVGVFVATKLLKKNLTRESIQNGYFKYYLI